MFRTDDNSIYNLLDFLRRAEGLKSTLRTTWTRNGRQESTAEHSWRLCLLAMLVSHNYPELDALKILQLCIIHDLGETINGDIPAPEQVGASKEKEEQERTDMLDLLRPLPAELQQELMGLWEEYEYAKTPEARIVKALDKLETLLQQTQGLNPPDFDYKFNLGYGVKYTRVDEFISGLRDIIDEETEGCVLARGDDLG
ncbi:HD domain-containing protein [Maridesulfovibrio sp.]|uniref:HD domain-containing protein n=1 Tax=Maridesulfovibrio sp. TaxID=2795000 RepID=UPI003BA97F9B